MFLRNDTDRSIQDLNVRHALARRSGHFPPQRPIYEPGETVEVADGAEHADAWTVAESWPEA